MTSTDAGGGRRPIVAVVGLGLMGGSLVRALRGHPFARTIVASDRDASTRETASGEGLVDRVDADAGRVVAEADVIVYATPLDVTLELMAAHAALWSADALITDVSSLKVPVREAARGAGAGPRWVGSHPMTGAEASGLAASRADLYEGAPVWLVAGEGGTAQRERAEALWRAVGAAPAWIDAEDHDARMVGASHLPQITSNALAAVLARAGVRREDLGPGGRDMTRLAGSGPDLWRPLLNHSKTPLAAGLRDLARELETLADALGQGDVDRVGALMERTRAWKETGRWS